MQAARVTATARSRGPEERIPSRYGRNA
jgi:hypothetical protein